MESEKKNLEGLENFWRSQIQSPTIGDAQLFGFVRMTIFSKISKKIQKNKILLFSHSGTTARVILALQILTFCVTMIQFGQIFLLCFILAQFWILVSFW